MINCVVCMWACVPWCVYGDEKTTSGSHFSPFLHNHVHPRAGAQVVRHSGAHFYPPSQLAGSKQWRVWCLFSWWQCFHLHFAVVSLSFKHVYRELKLQFAYCMLAVIFQKTFMFQNQAASSSSWWWIGLLMGIEFAEGRWDLVAVWTYNEGPHRCIVVSCGLLPESARTQIPIETKMKLQGFLVSPGNGGRGCTGSGDSTAKSCSLALGDSWNWPKIILLGNAG